MSDYYADPRISHSKLKEIRKSPAYFLHKLREPTKETDAMKLGTLCHMAVLEPDKLEQNYTALEEKIDRRTKEGKAAWAALQEASEGKVVVISIGSESVLLSISEPPLLKISVACSPVCPASLSSSRVSVTVSPAVP